MGIYNVYIIFDLAPETKTGNKDDIYVVHEVQATGPRAGQHCYPRNHTNKI